MIKITKRGNKAWVTFTTPFKDGKKVEIKGSWNDWKPEAMKRKKSGEYYITKVLPVKNSFEFGYLIDGSIWVADSDTPKVISPFGSENSVVKL